MPAFKSWQLPKSYLHSVKRLTIISGTRFKDIIGNEGNSQK